MFAYSFDCFTFALSVFFAFHLRFDGVPGSRLPSLDVGGRVHLDLGQVRRFHGGHRKPGLLAVYLLARGRADCPREFIGIDPGRSILFLFGPPIPRSVYILEWLVSCFLTVGSRLAVRVASTPRRRDRAGGDRARTLIYGSGAAGLALVQELRQNQSLKCDVVGLIDDDSRKIGLSFHGKRVLGTGETLAAWARKLAVKRVLIAIPSASGPQMVRILKFAVATGVDYKMVPSLGETLQRRGTGQADP